MPRSEADLKPGSFRLDPTRSHIQPALRAQCLFPSPEVIGMQREFRRTSVCSVDQRPSQRIQLITRFFGLTGQSLQRLRKPGRARATGGRGEKLNAAAKRQEHIET